jgi:hypothetical protein
VSKWGESVYDLKNLVGQSLSGYRIELWYVLFLSTGETSGQVAGYFTDRDLATAQGRGQGWYGRDGSVDGVYVLTQDGKTGYLVKIDKPVHLSEQESLANEAKRKALEKLTPEEQRLLGLM